MRKTMTSLSSWRAWIEMPSTRQRKSYAKRRSPHGERGLKYRRPCDTARCRSRSPHGERGLKCSDMVIVKPLGNSRSPHGERGLKSFCVWGYCFVRIVALLMESVD